MQIAYFEFAKRVRVRGVGPVLSLEDLAGWKVHAAVDRAEPRDFCDLAALMAGFTLAELIRLGQERDPSITARDIAKAGDALDRISDRRLERHLTGRTAGWVRFQLRDWPRTRPR